MKKSIDDLLKLGWKERWEKRKIKPITEKPSKSIFKKLFGFLIPKKECKCGKYSPVSSKGLIITTCKNCGGTEPVTIFN